MSVIIFILFLFFNFFFCYLCHYYFFLLIYRIGIPTATLYYSYTFGYWATGDKQHQLNDPVALATKDALSNALNQIEPYTEPYKSDLLTKWNNLKLAKMWNCGVRWTFNRLSQFDPAKEAKLLYEKTVKSINESGAK